MSEKHLSQELLTMEDVEKSGFLLFENPHEMRISRCFPKKLEPAPLHALQG